MKDGKDNENRYTQLIYIIYNTTTIKCLAGGLFVCFVCFYFVLFWGYFFKGLRALYSRLAYNDTMI